MDWVGQTRLPVFVCQFVYCHGHKTRKSLLCLPPWARSKTPFSLFVCLFVCRYKTRNFVRRLPPGLKVKPLGVYPLEPQLFLWSYQRNTTDQKHSTCQRRLTLHKLTGWLASLDSRRRTHASPMQVALQYSTKNFFFPLRKLIESPGSYSCADMMICQADLASQKLVKLNSLSSGTCHRKWNLSPSKYFCQRQPAIFLTIVSASEKVFARFFSHFFACSSLSEISVFGWTRCEI